MIARLRIATLLSLLALLAACAHELTPAGEEQVDAQRRANIRLELANAYFAEGQPTIALQELERVLALDPRRADALGLRGLALQQLGDSRRALQSLQQAVHIAPEDPALQNNLGWVLCESGQPDAALSHFDKALGHRSYASPAKAAMNAGLCSLRLGDRRRARGYFVRALQADPKLLPAHAELARIAFDERDYAGARSHLLPVIASDLAVADDFLLAIRTERALGDRAAEQSLAAQWRRRLPDSPQWQAYQSSITDER